MFVLSLVMFGSVAFAFRCSCTNEGITCLSDCSTTFCVCDSNGLGTRMNVSAGTRCFNGSLVHESQCLPRSFASACNCSKMGIQCLQPCSNQICMCDSDERVSLVPVANGTVCYDDRLTWLSDSRCSSEPVAIGCGHDGLYCVSPCSITYYYCSNGLRYPEQFVPYGTVCYSNGTGQGQLLNPDECFLGNQTMVGMCPTMETSLQCLNPCSTAFYYCSNYSAHVLQNAPTGLVCYDHSFVLESNPVCYSGSGLVQQFPVSIDYSNKSIVWSVLSQYALASALSESLRGVYPTDIYFSDKGRRLIASNMQLMIRSSDTTLPSSVATAWKNLPSKLAARNLPISVRLATVASATPSPSAVPAPTPSKLAQVSGVEAKYLSLLGIAALVVAFVFI